jgi:hypothetical protein
MSFVKKEDLYQEFVKHVQDYMFNNTLICKCIESKICEQYNQRKDKLEKVQIKENKDLESNFFFPCDKDSLFWCLYIIKNGITNYTKLVNRNFIIEKKIKINYVEQLRKEKLLLKPYKFASLTCIEDVLVNQTVINISTFLSLSVLSSLNIFFINKKTYFELNMNDSNKVYIIKFFHEKNTYGFEESNKDSLEDFRAKYYKVDNLDKPIKSIASYKTEEITEICKKLEIETMNQTKNKSKSKKELYEAIIKYF